jgi:hypothetical protein
MGGGRRAPVFKLVRSELPSTTPPLPTTCDLRRPQRHPIHPANPSFKPEQTEALREYDAETADDDGNGGNGGADLASDDDEDLVVMGNDFLNATCPITGKNVRRGGWGWGVCACAAWVGVDGLPVSWRQSTGSVCPAQPG